MHNFKEGDRVTRIFNFGGKPGMDSDFKVGQVYTINSIAADTGALSFEKGPTYADHWRFKLVSEEIEVGDTVECIDVSNIALECKVLYTVLSKDIKCPNKHVQETIEGDFFIRVNNEHTKSFAYSNRRFKLISKANKQENMLIYQVDEAFIKEAYQAACPTWKKKLEEKFPVLFPKYLPKLGDKLSANGTNYQLLKIGEEYTVINLDSFQVSSNRYPSIENFIERNQSMKPLVN